MFKKYIKQSLFVLAAMIFLAACTKNGTDYSVIKTTPPELHVVVVSDDNNTVKVAGATVTLYKSQTDLENSSNAIATKESGSDGEV